MLDVEGLVKHYPVPGRLRQGSATVRAVDGVSFELMPGEVLGLVGESGSGKSTVAKCIMRLVRPTAGAIRLFGEDITRRGRSAMRPQRRDIHMVFQDPQSSLNPRRTVGESVADPLRLQRLASGQELHRRVGELFDQVGLRAELRDRYPHELSGGQRQRVGIARALSVGPKVLIADEPVSALDVSVQASILNLLADLQANMRFSCLFITHDLSTVEYLCDRVAVMYLGEIVEIGPRAEVFRSPQHPYTQALLSAAPVADPALQRAKTRVALSGDIPSPADPPPGCRFHTRCPLADQSSPRCRAEVPALRPVDGDEHLAACHLLGGA